MTDIIKYILEKYEADHSYFKDTEMLVADPITVGQKLVIFTDYFIKVNKAYADAKNAYNKIKKTIAEGSDENGKAISSAKAKDLSEATDENCELEILEASVKNLDNILNSLKGLQKGLLGEYARAGNM